MNTKRIVHLLCAMLFVVSVAFGLASCNDNKTEIKGCEHKWVNATCTAPKTCSLCSATEGKELGHSYGEWTVKTEATCSAAGEKASVCATCNAEKTETIPAEGHTEANLVKSEAVAATHTTNGKIECYTCSDCNKYFADAEATEEIAADVAIILAAGHIRAEKHDAVPATHTENGTIEYWYCSVCDANFTDRSPEADLIPEGQEVMFAMGHERAVKHDAVPATHSKNGVAEYWYCETCDAKFDGRAPEAAKFESDEELVILAMGHDRAEKHDATVATHSENGNIEYWYCAVCDANFTDRTASAELIPEGEEVILAMGHTNATKFEGVAATHTTNGSWEYWYCETCDAKFDGRAPEAAKFESDEELVILATGHTNAIKVPAVAATHSTDGSWEYWYCETCDAKFDGRAPEAAKFESDAELVILAMGHTNAIKVPAVAATHTENGVAEYWYCETCDAKFEGRAPEAEELSDAELVILAMGHTNAIKTEGVAATHTTNGSWEYWYCETCDAKFDGRAPEAAKFESDDELVILAMGHTNAIKVEAGAEPTHTLPGSTGEAFYYCETCDACFEGRAPEAAELDPADLTVPALGHVGAVKIDGVAATHTTNGSWEYWYCETCDAKFDSAEANATKLTDEDIVILSMGHERAEKVEATAATHTSNGNWEYYYCSVCDKYFDGVAYDAAEVTVEEMTIVSMGHQRAEKVEATAATHTSNGNWEYYYCSVCDKYFDGVAYDAAEVTVEEMTIVSMGHERAEKVDAVAPTETEPGNVEYWHCDVCDKNFNGRAPEAEEIVDVVLPATGNNE